MVMMMMVVVEMVVLIMMMFKVLLEMLVVSMMMMIVVIFRRETSLTVTPSPGRERFSDSRCRWPTVPSNAGQLYQAKQLNQV